MLFSFDQPDFEREGRDWPNRATSRFVRSGGLTWHVQITGAGPGILLLHGTGAATHTWRDLLPLLSSQFTLVAPDLPGHGFSSPLETGRFSLQRTAALVGDLAKALGIPIELCIGHSAGVAILIQMGLDGHLSACTTIGFNAALLPFQGLARDLFPSMARLLVINPIVPRLFSFTTGPAAVERLIEGTGSRLDARGVELYTRLIGCSGHAAAALAMMANWDLEGFAQALPRFQGHLHLVVGDRDKAVPPDDAEAVRRRRPETRIHTMRHLGHLAHEEDPEAAAAIIRRIASDSGLAS